MWLNMWALRIDNEKGDQNKMYTQISFLTYTNLTYHYHLIYLFVYVAVIDMIHKDGSWIFVSSADLPLTSYSAPRWLKALSTLEWLAIKTDPKWPTKMEKIRRKILTRLNQAKSCEKALNALSTWRAAIKIFFVF